MHEITATMLLQMCLKEKRMYILLLYVKTKRIHTSLHTQSRSILIHFLFKVMDKLCKVMLESVIIIITRLITTYVLDE